VDEAGQTRGPDDAEDGEVEEPVERESGPRRRRRGRRGGRGRARPAAKAGE
jgi:hypothetical protein